MIRLPDLSRPLRRRHVPLVPSSDEPITLVLLDVPGWLLRRPVEVMTLTVARFEEVSETVAAMRLDWAGHAPVFEIECDRCGHEDQQSTWDAAVIAGEDHTCPEHRYEWRRGDRDWGDES